VNISAISLSASEAASRLGVSVKALRFYERRGLLTPARTAAGYRVYGARDMARAAEIVALRALGLSLVHVSRVLEGDPQSVALALAAHEARLDADIRAFVSAREKVRALREDIARGRPPASGELASLLRPLAEFNVAFALPWPWNGEPFELGDIRRINYIVGPLGSGKTRLAQRLAEALPGGAFLGLERSEADGAEASLNSDPALKLRVERTLAWLVDEGAAVSQALTALIVGLESEAHAVLVVDMVEQGLDAATQEALIAHLRQRARAGARPLFLMTRSSVILDLPAIGPDEAILFCPANHSPPTRVTPCPGAPGYETVQTCLASPEVRARTAGMIACIAAANRA
jgi:DNA-binding transcriptional MerR regulator